MGNTVIDFLEIVQAVDGHWKIALVRDEQRGIHQESYISEHAAMLHALNLYPGVQLRAASTAL